MSYSNDMNSVAAGEVHDIRIAALCTIAVGVEIIRIRGSMN